jgi:hypothetical protein
MLEVAFMIRIKEQKRQGKNYELTRVQSDWTSVVTENEITRRLYPKDFVPAKTVR